MIAVGFTGITLGVHGAIVRIEADTSAGTPSFTIVGLPDRTLGEARDRVRAAIFHSGMRFPAGKILVNLSPADTPKTGMGFDLPLALTLLAIDEQLDRARLARLLAVGELALDGTVRPVGGVLPIALAARERGFAEMLVAAENADEASLAGLRVYAVRHLADAFAVARGRAEPHRRAESTAPAAGLAPIEDFADVRGQRVAKRALEIAAAGGHNIRLIGPPGCGKSMLARRLPTILPPLSDSEMLETAAVRSAAGVARGTPTLDPRRPFRAPHHSISQAALVGGGRMPRPGEVSLAHNGVLFLDELPEFSRASLEALRQPLEEGRVVVGRSAATLTFPARVSLIVAMNPCPCGYRGERRAECRCDDALAARYVAKLSGPLLDRVDLHVRVGGLSVAELRAAPGGETSTAIAARVELARERQRARYGARDAVNAKAGGELLRGPAYLDEAAARMLFAHAERAHLSARAFDRVLRTARTIADLAGNERTTVDDATEALSFR